MALTIGQSLHATAQSGFVDVSRSRGNRRSLSTAQEADPDSNSDDSVSLWVNRRGGDDSNHHERKRRRREINEQVTTINVAEDGIEQLCSVLSRIGELAEVGATMTLASPLAGAIANETRSLTLEFNTIFEEHRFEQFVEQVLADLISPTYTQPTSLAPLDDVRVTNQGDARSTLQIITASKKQLEHLQTLLAEKLLSLKTDCQNLEADEEVEGQHSLRMLDEAATRLVSSLMALENSSDKELAMSAQGEILADVALHVIT